MNLALVDPFQNDCPEVIEEYLEHGITKCIAFNRRGTLLAAGCADGACVIWDFHTRGVAVELRDKGLTSPITSVSWSKCGHHLLAAATDKSLSCWDVSKATRIATTNLPQTALHARLHPGKSRPLICLACPMSRAPLIVDLESGEKYTLPLSSSPVTEVAAAPGRGKSEAAYSPSAACFNKRGDLIYVGNSKGEVLIIDTASREVRRTVQLAGNSVVRQIVFSRDGKYVLTNSTDRVLRVFENRLPRENPAAALADENSEDFATPMSLSKELLDGVARTHWKTACFSNDAEFVVGASGTKGEHKIYIWNREFGALARMLDCPKEGLIDVAWHPIRPLLASVSMSGIIYLWAKDYTENWSAFAPDFRELEENEEYVEREDEFDLNAEVEKAKPVQEEEDEEVDITTAEKVAVFSDSDESEANLYFLPTIPQPDSPVPEEETALPPSSPAKASQNPSDSNNDSPPSEDQNIELTTAVAQASSSPQEEEIGPNGRVRRKRRLSEKAAELLEAEKKAKSKTGKSKNSDELDEDEPPILKKHTKRKIKQVSHLSENPVAGESDGS